MAELGSAIFRIGADIADFKNKIEQVKTGFSAVGQTIENHADQIRKAGLGITAFGTAITGSFAYAINSTMELGDELDKTSIRTGVAVETLSSLSFAADMSGASFDDVATGMRKLAKNLSDADAGLATAKRAFEELGISIYDTDGSLRSVDDVMFDVSDKLAGMNDDTKATALAFEVFGRSGNALIPMLKEGSNGIKAMQKEANDLGAVMSTKLSKESARFNDNLGRLGTAITGLKFLVADTLMPPLNRLFDYVVEIQKEIVAWIKAHETLAKTIITIVAGVGGLAAAIGPLLFMLPSLVSGIKLVGAALTGMTGIVGIGITVIAALYTAWVSNLGGIQDAVYDWYDRIYATFQMLYDYLVPYMNKLANVIDTARLKIAEGQRWLMSTLGQDTTKLDAQLEEIRQNINAREQESAKAQTKTWDDYYEARRKQRAELSQTLDTKREEDEQKEIQHVGNLLVAHGQVRDLRLDADAKMRTSTDERLKKDREYFSSLEFYEKTEHDRFEEMLNTKILNAQEWAEKMGMSLDEFDKKAYETYVKIKTGHAEQLTEEEQRMSEYVAKITGDEGFNKIPPKAKESFLSVKIDWDRHLDSMADATANRIMNSELNFSSLKSVVSGVFNDIKDTVIGTFRQILAEYISGFIVKMIKATKDDLAVGLAGALGDAFGGLIGGVKSAIGSLVNAVTGGGGGAVSAAAGGSAAGGAASAAGAGGAGAGLTAAGLATAAATVGGVGAVIAGIVAAVNSGRGGWHDLSPGQFAAAEYGKFLQETSTISLRNGIAEALNEAASLEQMGLYDQAENARQRAKQFEATIQDALAARNKPYIPKAEGGVRLDADAQAEFLATISQLGYEIVPGGFSFGKGGNVPYTTQALLHAREMVLPPELADFIRSAASRASGMAAGISVSIGSISVSGAGSGIMDNISALGDIISERIADKVLRRVQVTGA